MGNKFENVDIYRSLRSIANLHTEYYISDLEIDKKFLEQSARSEDDAAKRLLWFSRPSGTFLGREDEVFQNGTSGHNTWVFYGTQTKDDLLAFAIEITGMQDDHIIGNLYELDYNQHCKEVLKKSFDSTTVNLEYNDGFEQIMPIQGLHYSPAQRHGGIKSMAFEPASDQRDNFDILLANESFAHHRLPAGDFEQYIKELQDVAIDKEAKRIQKDFISQVKPNSPHGNHYMSSMSNIFKQSFNAGMQHKLFEVLPYESTYFASLNKKGVYAFISKDEDRAQPLKLLNKKQKKERGTER